MVCNNYESVVDVYIPLKKSKLGKRFAFVRFIKVINLERLIENLCTIWIENYHLHANKVRFQREAKTNPPSHNNVKNTGFKPHAINSGTNNDSYVNSGNNKESFASILKEGTRIKFSPDHSIPAFVLDDSCLKERDLSLSLIGKVKEVSAIPNLYIILSNKGFSSVKLTYLGGFWVLIELDSTDSI
ncbi:RNA-directed DNA polymerase, eukaryota, nucleotide-binding alpha-beta plait domain protein [Tanacetum coccineum]